MSVNVEYYNTSYALTSEQIRESENSVGASNDINSRDQCSDENKSESSSLSESDRDSDNYNLASSSPKPHDNTPNSKDPSIPRPKESRRMKNCTRKCATATSVSVVVVVLLLGLAAMTTYIMTQSHGIAKKTIC